MKKTKYLLAGLPALLAVTVAFTPLVRAESGDSTDSATSTKTEVNKMESRTRVAEVETENETDSTTTESSDDSTSRTRAQEVAKHRAELRQKLQEMKAENKTRLDDARKKVCENRQEQINSIIKKRSEQATKQFEVFTKISDRVQEFVKTKNLTVENYDSLVAAINEKAAAAQAAIETNSGTTFDCATTSGDKPAQLPRTTIDAVRTALQEYRTAIKNLIVNVKASADKAESTTTAPSTSGEVSQ